MKSREHNSLPEEFLQGFENGSSDSVEKARRVWELLGNVQDKPLKVPTTDQALLELDSMLDEQPLKKARVGDRMPTRNKRRATFRRSVFAAVAACSVLIIGAIGFLSIPVTHTTTAGENLAVVLPDGSEVYLNNESSMEYRRGFRQWNGLKVTSREVKLDGEAFFTVAKDGRPFKVNTFNAEVSVLGTGFNIRAYSTDTDRETRITLDHGSVQVDIAGANTTSAVILNEIGQEAVVKNASIVESNITEEGSSLEWVTAWRNGGFVAMGLSLDDVISQIERFYATDIQVSEGLPQNPTDLIYTKNAPSIEELLTDFCISEGCRFQETASGYHLLPAE